MSNRENSQNIAENATNRQSTVDKKREQNVNVHDLKHLQGVVSGLTQHPSQEELQESKSKQQPKGRTNSV